MVLTQQIKLVLFSQCWILLCLGMSDPYWPLIVAQWWGEENDFMVKLLSVSIYMAPLFTAIIATPLWNRLGHRVGYKRMILRAIVVLVITQCLLAVVSNVWLALLIRLTQGAFAGFTAVAQAWLVTTARDAQHSTLLGKATACTALGGVLGPMLGGLVAYGCGYQHIFWLSSLSMLVLAVVLWLALTETPRSPFARMKATPSPLDAHTTSRAQFFLRVILLMQTLRWMSASFFSVYVIEQLAGNDVMVGLLYGIIALMIFVVAPRAGRWVTTHVASPALLARLLMIVSLLAAIAQLIFAHSDSLVMMMTGCVLWGICLGVQLPVPLSLLVSSVSPDKKGWLIGLAASHTKLGNLLGVGVGGALFMGLGFEGTFYGIALGYVLAAMVLRLGFHYFSQTPKVAGSVCA